MSKTVHTDLREMRKAINLAARGEASVGGERGNGWGMTSPAAPMIRNTMMAGEYAGWSGEDTMTVLAYHALLQFEDIHARFLETMSLLPSTSLIHKSLTNAETGSAETRMDTRS